MWRIYKVGRIEEIKEKLDRHEIDVTSLSEKEAIEIEQLYRKQILELDSQISDVNTQIEANKSIIRKELDSLKRNNK